MVPLRLRLQNFLSYGESAPVLDLEDIHVACLSGGNGQGKSALLDAMTWAVWGEARKSGEARKPDEELLRIGTREMEVDFSFRVGDVVYRIVRSYRQSASGKTSKPGLELQVRDGDDWRPLTAGSVRATQAVIDERVGIDYETFINSTFLLQGRSDEFTKKRPGERKEILGKILALGRYEAMAARAGQRWSRLREQATALEAEIERLDAALEPVSEWETERAAVEEVVQKASAELDTAAASVAKAVGRLSDLDAAARQAESLKASLASLAERLSRLGAEDAAAAAKIEAAAALIAQADEIEADHNRYETLRDRRADLDEKAGLFRGIDAQRHALRLDIQKRVAEANAELASLQSAIETLDRQIESDREALTGQADAEAAHAEAKAAVDALKQHEAAAAERRKIEQRIEAIDKQLAADKGALQGTMARVVDEGKQLAAEVKEADDVDLEALKTRVQSGTEASARREALQTEGTEASRVVGALDGKLEALAADRARVESRRQRLAASTDEACPTCGTELTERHRAEALASYDAELRGISETVREVRRERDEAAARRDGLRAEYVSLGTAADAGRQAEKDLASAVDRARQVADKQARLDALRAEARRIKREIADESFNPELRSERSALDDALRDVAYDAEAHAAVRTTAALLDHWAGRLRLLSVASERLKESQAERTRKAQRLSERRAALDRGDHVAEATGRMAALDAQVASLGFDPAEHERVGKALRDLSDAPNKLSRLLDARRKRAELTERRAVLADERRAVERDQAAQRDALAALQGQLEARAAAEAARTGAEATRKAAAARLAEAQGRLGALTERLDRAERDRQRRREVKGSLRDTKKQRALYGHLRRAFGKNGIPSLIIEETLPEIEARANSLLDRLTRGRTRIALETLKDKKTGGGTKETLDIRITDDQGASRPYETYSGGEAFRVNFALRIALSQMLAERSGTQIRTLVIDEGFGTQDSEGLQRLIGAIRAIQDDFDTILVITHLDELKDAFPVRIEVRKEPVTGSTFEIAGI